MSNNIKAKRIGPDQDKCHHNGKRIVHNNSGTDISADDIVHIAGIYSGGAYQAVAQAEHGDAATKTLVFVADHDIPDGEQGYIVPWKVLDLDTSAGALKDPVYLSATPGAITLTNPGTGLVIGRVLSVATAGKVIIDPKV